MKKILFITVSLISTTLLFAQSIPKDSSRLVKALVIIYDVTYPNKIPDLKSIYLNRVVTSIYGSKVSTITYALSGDVKITVSNDRNENSFSLFPNQQFMLKTNRNDKPYYPGGKFEQTISATNKTKRILDYDCKEINMVTDAQVGSVKTSTSNFLYTYDNLENYSLNYTNCKGQTGLTLGWNLDLSNGVTQLALANSITEQFVDSSMFEIPTDYAVYTMAEYTQKLTTDKDFLNKMQKEFGIEEQTVKVSRWKTFFDILLDVTPEILSAVNDINKPKSSTLVDNTNSNKGASNCASFQRRYELQRGFASHAYNSLHNKQTNDKIYGKFGKEYASTPNPALNVGTMQNLRSTQKVMRGIRELAAKNGCYIVQAPEETIR